MAEIIVSSKFIKTPNNKNIGKLLRCIGTREGAEKVAKGKDNPTKANATEFLDAFYERNADKIYFFRILVKNKY